MIVTCILYLILPNSFCFPLNRQSYVQLSKRNKNVQSAKEKRIDENSMAQIKEARLVNNLIKNTFDVQNNQIDKSNVDDDGFELNDYTKYKDDNTQYNINYLPSSYVAIACANLIQTDTKYLSHIILPKNKRIGSLIIAKGIRKTTIQQQPESSSNIYIYINGNLDQKRTVWRFYYVNPERTELLSDN
ncbi:hypothetical protein QTP88_008933 [Uroleucon formosanum]